MLVNVGIVKVRIVKESSAHSWFTKVSKVTESSAQIGKMGV